MKRTDIAILIKSAVAEFGMTPREINSGYCVEFAELLQDKFSGFKYEVSKKSDPFNHDWVSYRGYHYDAETPEGVRSRRLIGLKPEYRPLRKGDE